MTATSRGAGAFAPPDFKAYAASARTGSQNANRGSVGSVAYQGLVLLRWDAVSSPLRRFLSSSKS